ncbi:tRNA pseudouridine synthase Pus10 [Nymphalis io]|uniref:tRNA pseudouridine synthase Pus10 n=1 Tax=Inachis io TaxID=171585 RepID=UPI002168F5EF|nr:tRNA pseudouridine synthase Pus10 [Nymphalis io]
MDQKAIYKFCKSLGCCEACCIRYIGIKNPNAFENATKFVTKFHEENEVERIDTDKIMTDDVSAHKSDENSASHSSNVRNSDENTDNSIDSKENNTNNGSIDVTAAILDSNGSMSPPHKKRKLNICVSCLGVLQQDNWQECYQMVKEILDKKGYECNTFACALSAPIATLLREKAVTLHLIDEFPQYDAKTLTPLKEAWKWSFGVKLGAYINKTLDSGAISPLLITVNIDYVDELQELEILKTVSPQLFAERSKQKRRFVTEFTRRSVEQALELATLWSLSAGDALRAPHSRAACVGAACAHAPLYLAGRYIKLSRNLPQSPWILEGKRVLPSSVQEIIFGPLNKCYKFDPEDADRRFKFIAAGREDVDVRCLGDGRPFAVEISDPTRQLTVEELKEVCEEISKGGEVIVKEMSTITKEDLVQLKKGEETKSKTYEALCIKLSHSKFDEDHTAPIRVTPEDIERINTYTNTTNKDVKIALQQKTPIRVLHRRPLLTRNREILELTASLIPEHPQLFALRARTSAGTYVKEWAHGELGRSAPALPHALLARADLLALDVRAVHLAWPPRAAQ